MMNRRERGFSLLELLIVVAIIITITAIAIPNVLKMKMGAGNETSAMGSLKAMNEACMYYYSSYSSYPHNQSDLGPPANGPATKTAADLLDSILAPASGTVASKAGYVFRYVAGPPATSGNVNGYTIFADPETFERTGVKRFYTDQKATIRYTTDGTPASAASPQI